MIGAIIVTLLLALISPRLAIWYLLVLLVIAKMQGVV